MGLERTTSVFLGARAHECTVHLEPRELVCRGELARKFPLAGLQDLAVQKGRLLFSSGGERIGIELGDAAATWLDRIRNPRSRMQKLGVVADSTVCVLGKAEADAVAELTAALGAPPRTRLVAEAELVLCFCAEPDDLERLVTIAGKLAEKGAVWVLWPKGRKDFGHEHVVARAKAAGLSSTKSVGFSEALTGLRFVRAKR